jgi:hypothetical protein
MQTAAALPAYGERVKASTINKGRLIDISFSGFFTVSDIFLIVEERSLSIYSHVRGLYTKNQEPI